MNEEGQERNHQISESAGKSVLTRGRWIEATIQTAWSSGVPTGDQATALGTLSPDSRDEFSRALVVAEVIRRYVDGESPIEVDRSIRRLGFAYGDSLTHLVEPILQNFKAMGLPFVHSWDVDSFWWLVTELWIAHLRESMPDSVLLERVSRVLDNISANNVAALVASSVGLSPELDSRIGHYPFLAEAVRRQRISVLLEDETSSDERSDGTRPDLDQLYEVLRFALENQATDNPVLSGEVREWLSELEDVVRQLTQWEMKRLLTQRHEDDYIHGALAAGGKIVSVWLSMPGGLQEQEQAGSAATGWLQDLVLREGFRVWHGEMPGFGLWAAVAESREQREAFTGILSGHISPKLGLKSLDMSSGSMTISLLIEDDAEAGPMILPFIYSVRFAKEAWSLLHLLSTGHVRLILLDLPSDGELTFLGNLHLSFPAKLREELGSACVRTLRSLVGDDFVLLRRYVAELDHSLEDRDVAAFLYAEKGKSEDLQVLFEAAAGPQDQADQQLISAMRHLAKARSVLVHAALDEEETDEQLDEFEAASSEWSRHLEHWHGAKADEREYADNRTQLASAANALPENSAMVHLMVKDGFFQAAILTVDDGKRIHLRRVSLDDLSWTLIIEELQRWDTYDTSTYDRALSLSQSIMEPVLSELVLRNTRRVYVSPVRPLDRLPLHAVHMPGDESRLALDMFESFSYIPSTDILTALKSRTVARDSDKVLLVAHAGGHLHSVQLEGPSTEMTVLRQIYEESTVLVDAKATPTDVLGHLPKCKIAHIASHGMAANDRWATGLILEGESLGEATLAAADIATLSLKLDVEVVVLSACRTGVDHSRLAVVEAIRGMDAAFLGAGARTVVSSLWEIPDSTALVFSTVFHCLLQDGLTAGSAYAGAVAYLRTSGPIEAIYELPIRRAEDLLEQFSPGWRDELAREGASEPQAWAAFRLSGIAHSWE